MKDIKECPVCHRDFIAQHYNTKCCSPDCAARYRKIYHREYNREYFGKERGNDKPARQSAPDIARIARDAGMSYGQYMAVMRFQRLMGTVE